jgi:hypothetical protein
VPAHPNRFSREIGIAISTEENGLLGSVRQVNPEAYKAFQRLRSSNRWSGEDFKNAIEYLPMGRKSKLLTGLTLSFALR